MADEPKATTEATAEVKSDPNVQDPVTVAEAKIARKREELQKAEMALEQAKVGKVLQAKSAEFSQYVSTAVKDAVAAVGVPVPSTGLWIHVTEDSTGSVLCSVLLSPPKAMRAASTGPRKAKSGNGTSERLTISALGITEYTLPDGKSVKSPAQVLDAFDYPYYAKSHTGDAPHRQIYKFVRENVDTADNILVTLPDGSTPTLTEAVEAQGVVITRPEAAPTK